MGPPRLVSTIQFLSTAALPCNFFFLEIVLGTTFCAILFFKPFQASRALADHNTCQDSVLGGRVVSLFRVPFLHIRFALQVSWSRAIRAILPLADGGTAHLFVVYGFQSAEVDPHKVALTNKLMEGVLGEARACGTGQPERINEDLDAEPVIIFATAKAIFYGHFIDLEKAFALRRERAAFSHLYL